MICPACSSAECRRSRRRTLFDYLASVLGYIPWRCSRCSKRFRSRATPFANLLSAHCSICGNIEVKRISPELAEGLALRSGVLSASPLPLHSCRHKFFPFCPSANRFRTPVQNRQLTSCFVHVPARQTRRLAYTISCLSLSALWVDVRRA